jgi:hypothetical protein
MVARTETNAESVEGAVGGLGDISDGLAICGEARGRLPGEAGR